jgi:YgiT-type zinc finger domain-containing protein
MKCANCNHEKLENGTVKRTKRIGELSYKAKLPAQICPNCNESYISMETLRKFSTQIADDLIQQGIRTPAAIEFLRKHFMYRLLNETTGEEK